MPGWEISAKPQNVDGNHVPRPRGEYPITVMPNSAAVAITIPRIDRIRGGHDVWGWLTFLGFLLVRPGGDFNLGSSDGVNLFYGKSVD